MSCHVRPPSIRAVLAAVVLLIEPLRFAGGHDELVDALTGLGCGSGRKSARTPRLRGSQVAPPSRVSKVPTAEIADPHPLGIGRVGDDRVEDEAAGAGLPGRAAGMVRQALDVGPRPAAVVAPEEPRGADAGEHRPMGRGDVPDGGDLGAVVAIGEALARLGPALAEVVAPEDRRAVPRRTATGIQRAGVGVAADVLDRVALAGRSADRPGPASRHRTRG